MADRTFHLVINSVLAPDGGYRDVVATEGALGPSRDANRFSRASNPSNFLLKQENTSGVALCQHTEAGAEAWNAFVVTALKRGTPRDFVQSCRLGAPASSWDEVMLCLPSLYRQIMQVQPQRQVLDLPLRRFSIDRSAPRMAAALLEHNDPIALQPMEDAGWWAEHGDKLARVLPCLLSAPGLALVTLPAIEDQLTVVSGLASLLPAQCRPFLTLASRADVSEREDEVRLLFQRPRGVKRPVFLWPQGAFESGWQPDEALPLPPEYLKALGTHLGREQLRRQLRNQTPAQRTSPTGGVTASLYLTFLRAVPGGQPVHDIAADILSEVDPARCLRRGSRFLEAVVPEIDSFAEQDLRNLADLNWKLLVSDRSRAQELSGRFPKLMRIQARTFVNDATSLAQLYREMQGDATHFLVSLGQDFWSVDGLIPALTAALVAGGRSPRHLLDSLQQAGYLPRSEETAALSAWLPAARSKHDALQALAYWLQAQDNRSYTLTIDRQALKQQLPGTATLLESLDSKQAGLFSLEKVAQEIGDPTVIDQLEAFVLKRDRVDLVRLGTLLRAVAVQGTLPQRTALAEVERRSRGMARDEALGCYRTLCAAGEGAATARDALALQLVELAFETADWALLPELGWRGFARWSPRVETRARSLFGPNTKQDRYGEGTNDTASRKSGDLQTACIKAAESIRFGEETNRKVSVSALLLVITSVRMDAASLTPQRWDADRAPRQSADPDTVKAVGLVATLLDQQQSKTLLAGRDVDDPAYATWTHYLDMMTRHYASSILLSRRPAAQDATEALGYLADLYHETGRDEDFKRIVEEVLQGAPAAYVLPNLAPVQEVFKLRRHKGVADMVHKKAKAQQVSLGRGPGESQSSLSAVLMPTLLGVCLVGLIGLAAWTAVETARIGVLEEKAMAAATTITRLEALDQRLRTLESAEPAASTAPASGQDVGAATAVADMNVRMDSVEARIQALESEVAAAANAQAQASPDSIEMLPLPTLAPTPEPPTPGAPASEDGVPAAPAEAGQFNIGDRVVVPDAYLLTAPDNQAETLPLSSLVPCQILASETRDDRTWFKLDCGSDGIGWRLANELPTP